MGLAACFYAGTVCSILAVILTIKINDDKAGLSCGLCLSIINPSSVVDQTEISPTVEKDNDDKIILKQPISNETHDPTSAPRCQTIRQFEEEERIEV